MNISTGIMFGEVHNFHDHEFKELCNLIKRTFLEIKQNVVARVIVNLFPKALIRNRIFRRVVRWALPTFDRMGDNVYNNFYPFLIRKIKEHQVDHDEQNPRDYLDFLISATRSNERIGWHSLIFTTFSLYLGGSDTITTTMRWVIVSLSNKVDVQRKCQKEIEHALDT